MKRESIIERLIAEGRARPARGDLSAFPDEHPPLPATHGDRPLSDLVIESRADERL